MVVSAIHRHETVMGAHVSPHSEAPSHLPPLPHPSGLSQSTSFECPASFIKLVLVIYFTYGTRSFNWENTRGYETGGEDNAQWILHLLDISTKF